MFCLKKIFFLVLPNHEEVINAIQNMGYPREEVISALKKSFYDPDRAVEYLCNGIPDDIEQAAIDGDLNGSFKKIQMLFFICNLIL